MIDGVLCIRCKSEADYAKFFGNLESHTSRGVALTAEETGMGVGMLIVKPDVELERENSVIAHELQHIYKQGSNHLEPEIERRNIFLERRRRGEWSPLTPQGEVDQEELNAFMRAEKEDCKRLLKDEVLAFLITHHISMEEVERSMTSESSHYNYFKESEEKRLIDAAIAHVESQAKDPMKLAFAVYDAFKKTKAEYAQESKQIMRDVVDTVKHLQQTGMSETEARAYLRDYLMFVPVDLWQFTLDKLRRSKIQKLESVG
jgi:hypothetical protein